MVAYRGQRGRVKSQYIPLYVILIFELYKMLHLLKNSNSIKHRGKGKWEIILDARAQNFSLLPPPKMDAKSAVPGIPRSHGPRSGGRVTSGGRAWSENGQPAGAGCRGLPFLTHHRRQQEARGWDLPQASIAQGLPTSGGLCPRSAP